jgi:hypothetical protein
VSLLYSAKIIITECGSTALNAFLFSSCFSKKIVLTPPRLLKKSSTNMLLSGIPYLISYVDEASIVVGDTIVEMPLESSDIAMYKISSINSAFDSNASNVII